MGMKLKLRGFQFLYFRIKHPNRCEPVVDILSAIASRYAAGAADREIDFPSALVELLGNLRTGLSGADDEHCTSRQGRRIPVLAGVNLQDVRRNVRTEERNSRRLIEASRDDYIIGFVFTFTCTYDKSLTLLFHTEDFDAAVHGQGEAFDVVVEVLDGLLLRHEAVRIVAVVFRARHAHLEVGRYESE